MVLAARPMHYLCGRRIQIRCGNAHGLFALSKIPRQLALFLSLKYRPKQGNCDDFCGTLFQNKVQVSKNKSHIINA